MINFPVELKQFISKIVVKANNEQAILYFPNHYGASIVRNPISYGYKNKNWELAVIKKDAIRDQNEWVLACDTPIADGVIGDLTQLEVIETLYQIKDLQYA